MAQNRYRGGYDQQGGRREDFQTDDLRYRGRDESGRYGGDYGGRQQHGERFSADWSGERADFGGPEGGDYGGRQGYRDQRGHGSDDFGGYGQQGGERGFGDRGFSAGDDFRGERGYGGGYAGQRDFGHGGRRFGGSGRGSEFRGERGFGGGAYGESRGYGSDRHGGERFYGDRSYGDRSSGDRGFWDKAADEVSSWFGDRDAERRREQDHHRGRGPKSYTRSDDRIREDVNDRLTDDWHVDASDITVEVKDREVTLSGEVSSREDKRRAEDIAESVSGVTHVQNNLRVKRRSDDRGSSTFGVSEGAASGGGSTGGASGSGSGGSASSGATGATAMGSGSSSGASGSAVGGSGTTTGATSSTAGTSGSRSTGA